MNIETNKRDYFWSYFAYILKFGANLFIIPLVLRLLNSSQYGLWVTFSSLGTIVNLFDFGFSNTILRNMTYVWGGAKEIQAEGCKITDGNSKRNDRLFALTFFTCRRIYFIIGLIVIVASYTIGLVYIKYIIRDMYRSEYVIAWLIYGANIGLNLYYAYWTVSLRSVGAIQQAQKATVIGYIVHIAMSFTGLLMGWGIISLSVAGCLSGITIRQVSRIYFTHYKDAGEILEEYRKSFKNSEFANMFRILWYNAKRAGISSIATVAMTQSTTLLSSAYLGVVITGKYGLCLQLLTSMTGVAQIYYQTTIPQLTQARHHNDLGKCQKQFSLSITLAWAICALGFVTVVLFFNPLLVLIKSQTVLNIPMFIIMAAYTFGEMNYSMHASYISFENRLPFVPSVIMTSIIIILLSFLSVYANLGIWGIMGARFIAELAYIFWKWPYVAHRQLALNTVGIIRVGTSEWGSIIKRVLCYHQKKLKDVRYFYDRI